MSAMIQVAGLVKRYPRTRASERSLWSVLREEPMTGHTREDSGDVILEGLDFELKAGEVLGLLGPNGAGKTTLLRILAGITRPDAGEVRLSAMPHAILGLGNTFHQHLTGRENASRELRLHGLRADRISEALEEIADFADLGDYYDREVRSYSAGMVTRLAFSIATSFSPRILLLDEVLAVGDEQFFNKSKARIHSLLKTGTTAVIATHYWPMTLEFASHIGWLHNGRFRRYGAMAEVIPEFVRHNKLISMPPADPDVRIVSASTIVRETVVRVTLDVVNNSPETEIDVHFHLFRADQANRFVYAVKLVSSGLFSGLVAVDIPRDNLPAGEYMLNLVALPKGGDARNGVLDNYNWILRPAVRFSLGGPAPAVFAKRLQWSQT